MQSPFVTEIRPTLTDGSSEVNETIDSGRPMATSLSRPLCLPGS